MKFTSKKLQRNYDEVLNIIDGLNLPIDKGIRYIVAILRSLGFETTSSCSGHLTGQTPYVQISSKESEKLESSSAFLNALNSIQKYPNNRNYQSKYETFVEKFKQFNKDEAYRLSRFIYEFYKIHKNNHVRLTINPIGDGFGGYRLVIEDEIFTELLSKARYRSWLMESQKELKSFADFLCDKIDDNENN